MITNERQYQITRAQAARFRDGQKAPTPQGVPPKALKAMREGTQSQLKDLEVELADYERLRGGSVGSLTADSITGIGEVLIKARVARQLTHKALADRLAVAEQQVQRYEATHYAGASIERLQAVADALKLRVHEVFTLEPE